jgi:predicted site-specific integrase-resolvase
VYKKSSSKRWLRKAQVRARYAGVSNKTLERHVAAGRLPPPEYPLGNRIPLWDEEVLEENERKAALARRVPVATGRPYQKTTVAEEAETAA